MAQKKLQLPDTPSYYQNPLQQGDISTLSGIGHQLTSGQFNSGPGGDLSFLSQATNPNQGYLTSALQSAQGILQPQFRDTLQQINNQAAANNQLNSSTYTDALARSQSDLNSQYQSMVGQAGMQDYTNAMNNRLSLFGEGLNTLQGAIGNEQQDSGAQNQFNLENYSNQVAQAISNHQQQASGNTFGNILSSISPVAHDIFSGLGYNVPGMGIEQTGLAAASIAAGGIGGIAGAGLSALGNGLQRGGGLSGTSPSFSPGSSASNNVFGDPMNAQFNARGQKNPYFV